MPSNVCVSARTVGSYPGADRADSLVRLRALSYTEGVTQVEPKFVKAFPFQKDVLALPVTDLDAASQWYCAHFGMVEVERHPLPVPTVILERDGTRIGFAVNGGDASQDGAAVLVSNIQAIKEELERAGTGTGNWRVDEQDGRKQQVFFVVAPDGLCYYFHEPIEGGCL